MQVLGYNNNLKFCYYCAGTTAIKPFTEKTQAYQKNIQITKIAYKK